MFSRKRPKHVRATDAPPSEALAQSLAAEGLARDAFARTNALPDEVMRSIEAQFVALEMVPELIAGERPVTTSFIRELHRALTRTQPTYRAFRRFPSNPDWQLRDPR